MLKAARTFVLQVVLISVITLGLLEILVALGFRYPGAALIPMPVLQIMHIQFDRKTIQVLPECAIYDKDVTYTLRPGVCTFSNREFSNEYRINRLGVRDDEPSLEAPTVVMLGDSFTMGWGVNQEEAFPAVYERLTGNRTLNAGISSFGTVRELRLLKRIDRSRLKYLVIQYTGNDAIENNQYIRSNGELRILTEAEYDRTVEDHRRSLTYFPAKYALNTLVQLKNAVTQRSQGSGAAQGRRAEAETFLSVLKASPVDLRNIPLTVLSLESDFIQAAMDASAGSDADWIRSIRYLDLGPLTRFDNAFYRLDDHPRAAVHEKVAHELVRRLRPEGSS